MQSAVLWYTLHLWLYNYIAGERSVRAAEMSRAVGGGGGLDNGFGKTCVITCIECTNIDICI